jgi:hypothetical protein
VTIHHLHDDLTRRAGRENARLAKAAKASALVDLLRDYQRAHGHVRRLSIANATGRGHVDELIPCACALCARARDLVGVPPITDAP